MKKMFQIVFVLTLLVMLTGCPRNPKDVTPPAFEYLSPVDGVVYNEDAIKMNIAGRVVDWNSISAGHPEYFAPDGVHLVPTGVSAYVIAIDEALK